MVGQRVLPDPLQPQRRGLVDALWCHSPAHSKHSSHNIPLSMCNLMPQHLCTILYPIHTISRSEEVRHACTNHYKFSAFWPPMHWTCSDSTCEVRHACTNHYKFSALEASDMRARITTSSVHWRRLTCVHESLQVQCIGGVRHACTNHYKFSAFGLQCTELVVIRARMSDLLCLQIP